MDKDEIIKQLQEVIAQLKHENELLQTRIRELEAQLAKYENPHTAEPETWRQCQKQSE